MTEQRRLAAILVADVVGYSQLIGSDEAGTLAELQALRAELIEPQISKYAGRLFKSVGDGFLIEFASAVQAVSCAKAISPFDQWISNYSNGMAFSLNTSGRFEEGLRWARKCMQENPLWVASHRQLIAALSLNGRMMEARDRANKYRTIDPNFTVYTWAANTPFRRSAGQERLFAALVEAGLPP
jgi:hypothetical protein